MKTPVVSRFALVCGAMMLDEHGPYVTHAAHSERDAAQTHDILNLHLQLAGAQLQARNGWERYSGANASRLAVEKKLQQAQDDLSAARAEIARLQGVLAQAQTLAMQDAPSWGHRIERLYAMLGLDCGGAERVNYALAAEVMGPVGDAGDTDPVASKVSFCTPVANIAGFADLPEGDKRELALFAQALRNDACPYCGQAVCPKPADAQGGTTPAA